jgi:hypothetical protein
LYRENVSQSWGFLFFCDLTYLLPLGISISSAFLEISLLVHSTPTVFILTRLGVQSNYTSTHQTWLWPGANHDVARFFLPLLGLLLRETSWSCLWSGHFGDNAAAEETPPFALSALIFCLHD